MRSTVKLSGLAILASMAILVGCSATPPPTETEQEDVTLTWWFRNDTSDASKEAIATLISDFETANPNITIDLQQRAPRDLQDALRASLGTPAAPDIYLSGAGLGLAGEYEKVGASVDLTEYYEEYGWDKRFSESAITAMKQYGGYHGVPWGQASVALFYNKTLFEAAGIDSPPETYDELLDAAEALKDSGVIPLALGGTVNFHIMRLLDSILVAKCGLDTFGELTTSKVKWTSEPCVTEAFEDLATWTTDYLNPGFAGVNNDEASGLFFSGQSAMALEGDWFNASVVSAGVNVDDFGIFRFPTDTDSIYGFVTALYVSSESEHPDAAAKFLDFVTSEEEQLKVQGAFYAQSVNTAVPMAEDRPLNEYWVEILDGIDSIYQPMDQNLELPQVTEWWRIMNLVATGQMDPDDAADEFQKFVDNQ